MPSEEQPMHTGPVSVGAVDRSGGTLRVCAAEALGAALLVLLSCLPPPDDATARALAAGLVVAMLVQCFDHISGAMFNPAVLVAAVVRGRVGRGRGAAMLVAQVAGGAGGAALLRCGGGGAARLAGALTLPAAGLSAPAAAALEAVLGGCLALANCASWDARNAALKDSWPLRIGACVAGMSLVAGSLTGASMNPARSFGPALLTGHFHQHWVYWVGPLGGSLLFTWLYGAVWAPPPPPPPPPPLYNDKQLHCDADV